MHYLEILRFSHLLNDRSVDGLVSCFLDVFSTLQQNLGFLTQSNRVLTSDTTILPHRQTLTHTDRQTERQTDRETDRETDRQTDRETVPWLPHAELESAHEQYDHPTA